MTILQRFTTTLSPSLVNLLDRLESMGAVSANAVAPIRLSLADARLRLARVERDREVLEDKLERQQRIAQRWVERSARFADDELRAKRCLHQSELCQQQIQAVQSALDDFDYRSSQLTHAIARLDVDLQKSDSEVGEVAGRAMIVKAYRGLLALQANECWALDQVFTGWSLRNPTLCAGHSAQLSA